MTGMAWEVGCVPEGYLSRLSRLSAPPHPTQRNNCLAQGLMHTPNTWPADPHNNNNNNNNNNTNNNNNSNNSNNNRKHADTGRSY